MHQVTERDEAGELTIVEHAPHLIEVIVRGRLSRTVGEAFPRYADALAVTRRRRAVFLDVRALEQFDASVRQSWLATVMRHRAHLEEVVVLSSRLLVTLSAKAASVAATAMGMTFDVVTGANEYRTRLLTAELATAPSSLHFES
jgi:hypothetical protein